MAVHRKVKGHAESWLWYMFNVACWNIPGPGPQEYDGLLGCFRGSWAIVYVLLGSRYPAMRGAD